MVKFKVKSRNFEPIGTKCGT